jgi:hypothetical protein
MDRVGKRKALLELGSVGRMTGREQFSKAEWSISWGQWGGGGCTGRQGASFLKQLYLDVTCHTIHSLKEHKALVFNMFTKVHAGGLPGASVLAYRGMWVHKNTWGGLECS